MSDEANQEIAIKRARKRVHEQWKAQSARREADEKNRRANAEAFQAQAEAYYSKIQSEGVLVTSTVQ